MKPESIDRFIADMWDWQGDTKMLAAMQGYREEKVSIQKPVTSRRDPTAKRFMCRSFGHKWRKEKTWTVCARCTAFKPHKDATAEQLAQYGKIKERLT
jgi:hypothetical protein